MKIESLCFLTNESLFYLTREQVGPLNFRLSMHRRDIAYDENENLSLSDAVPYLSQDASQRIEVLQGRSFLLSGLVAVNRKKKWVALHRDNFLGVMFFDPETLEFCVLNFENVNDERCHDIRRHFLPF